MHHDGLVVEGEQFYEICIRTDLDKYLTFLFYYTGYLKFWLNFYRMFNLPKRRSKLTMNVGSQTASE
jgi:hypothetical protein